MLLKLSSQVPFGARTVSFPFPFHSSRGCRWQVSLRKLQFPEDLLADVDRTQSRDQKLCVLLENLDFDNIPIVRFPTAKEEDKGITTLSDFASVDLPTPYRDLKPITHPRLTFEFSQEDKKSNRLNVALERNNLLFLIPKSWRERDEVGDG